MYFGTTRTTGTTHIHIYILGSIYTLVMAIYTFPYKATCENSCPSCPNRLKNQTYQAFQLGQLREKEWAIGQLEWARRPIC